MIMLMEIVICSVVANTVLKYRSRCWWFLVIVVLDNVWWCRGGFGLYYEPIDGDYNIWCDGRYNSVVTLYMLVVSCDYGSRLYLVVP